MSNLGHGTVGAREQDFTALLPLRAAGYPTHLLAELAKNIAATPDNVSDGADAEENRWVPAGYTYFGQFIDHDLTFDNTSSLNPSDVGAADRLPTNLRTPRFDLDSLYGDGPDAQPFLYAQDGATLLFKDGTTDGDPTPPDQVPPGNPIPPHPVLTFDQQAEQDLLRSSNGRAIIGDKRNDENSIVSQIQLSFVKFHNAVVAKLKTPDLTGTNLFNEARKQVRWAYQKLVIEDFLPRIVKAEVFEDLQKAGTPQRRQSLYALYTPDKRENLPREFVVAAYRFGHSGVRFGYRLNRETNLSIFAPSNHPTQDSLLGFDPLPQAHVVDDWGRFFPTTVPYIDPSDRSDPHLDLGPEELEDPKGVRLQFAYKIDPTLVDPLTVLPPEVLPTSPNPGGAIQEVKDAISPDPIPDPQHRDRPSLALLNLLRGNNYRVQSGQAIAQVLKAKGFRGKGFVPIEPLDPKYLVTRKEQPDRGDGKTFFKFEPIDPTLRSDTPLWFYILAEAQASIVDGIQPYLETDGTFSEDKLLKPEVAKTQLGWVGGRIVAEVFYGLIDSDSDSYAYAPPGWKPIWTNDFGDEVIFANLLKFVGQLISPNPKKK
jgi:Animal haem peroxidase